MPLIFYQEVIHKFFSKMVMDLTPLDARFAQAALQSRIGYIGIAFNDEHAEMMKSKLIKDLKTLMLEEGSGVFSAAYATAVSNAETPAKPEPAPTAKPKAKTKAKGNKKATKAAPIADASEDDEEPESPMWDPLDE